MLRIVLLLLTAAGGGSTVASAPASASSTAGEATYVVPSVRLDDLRLNRRTRSSSSSFLEVAKTAAEDGEEARSTLIRALSTTGIVALTLRPGDDDYEEEWPRRSALGGLCPCDFAASPAAAAAGGAESRKDSSGSSNAIAAATATTRTVILDDGVTSRATIGTATMGFDHPLPLPSDLESRCAAGPGADGNGRGRGGLIQAMDQLRDVVSGASRVFVEALDDLLENGDGSSGSKNAAAASLTKTATRKPLLETIHGAKYNTLTDVVRASRHLEHFHVYDRPLNANDGSDGEDGKDDSYALDLHVDAGLFLAFVPGNRCPSADKQHEEREDDDAFYLRDPSDGSIKRVVLPEHTGGEEGDERSVVIMLGAGAERWLQQSGGDDSSSKLTLRATRHAVKMAPGERRAWYGMMHLVPDSTIVQNRPGSDDPVTFADMRRAVASSSSSPPGATVDAAPSSAIDVGCGIVPEDDLPSSRNGDAEKARTAETTTKKKKPRARLLVHDDPSSCNNVTNFYCWMSCQTIPDKDNLQDHLDDGESLYCLDPAVLASQHDGGAVEAAVQPCLDPQTGAAGGAMDPACVGSWQTTSAGVPAQAFASDGQDGGSGAVYKEQYCYGGTSMYMQGFQWTDSTCIIYLFPSWTLSSTAKFTLACLGTVAAAMGLEGVIHARRGVLAKFAPGSINSSPIKYLALSAGTYGTQLSLGYLLMLIVMTYSVPLFLSVIAGLVGGHVLFAARRLGGRGGRQAAPVPEGCTPCCQNDLGGPITGNHNEEVEPEAEAVHGIALGGGGSSCCGPEEPEEKPEPRCCCDAVTDETDDLNTSSVGSGSNV